MSASEGMTCAAIIYEYLEQHGYTGLCNDSRTRPVGYCQCYLDDGLFPCLEGEMNPIDLDCFAIRTRPKKGAI